jgi:hypothetical protein
VTGIAYWIVDTDSGRNTSTWVFNFHCSLIYHITGLFFFLRDAIIVKFYGKVFSAKEKSIAKDTLNSALKNIPVLGSSLI